MGKNNRFESRGSFRGGYGRGGFNRGSFRGRNFGGNRDGYNNYNTWNNRGNEWQQRPPRRDTPGKRLTEEEIGVTEYLSDHEGFEGIIKLRYSDFQVSEINLQGEVAELTDMTPPKPPPEEEVLEDEDLLTLKYNVEILSMDMWNRLNKLIVGGEDAEERIELDVTTSSKEERTKIHEAVKKAFGDAIVGSTVTVDDKKYVKFEKYKKGVRVDKRVKWIWPADYVYFIVHKENCDTMDAAIKIADKLRMHIKPSMLGYAGTKDRRAKTSQWFSVRRVEPARLAAAGRALPDLALGNYSFQPRVLRLGMLAGNRFRIALRNVTAPDRVIAAACDHLRTNGFINYYGLQRFGTRAEVPTFAIGRSLLQGDYKQAVHYMVGAEGGAGGGVIRGAAGAAAGALRAALRARPNDLQTAIHKVPRNTRLLYVHSYQSLIWNRCVSERLRRHGLVPAPGDLVPETALPLVEESEDEEQENEDEKHDEKSDEKFDEKPDEDFDQKPDEKFDEKPNEKFDEKPDKKPDVKPDSEPQTSEAGQSKEKNPSNKEEKQKIPVKVLTQEDVDSGKYTLFDIIMPLPGYNIDYPPNMLDYYEKLLKEDGLTTELRNKNKSYSMSGAYRPLAVVPRGVEWSRVRYDDPLADLLASDLDKLRGRQLTGIVPDGKFSALLLTITLPVSSYATMALRELLRVNTSPESQAANNQYHMKDDGPPLKKQKVDE